MRTKSAIADFYGSSENGGEGEILENFTYNTQESLSRDFHDISLSKDDLGLGNCNWLLLFGFHTMQRYRSLLQLFVDQPVSLRLVCLLFLGLVSGQQSLLLLLLPVFIVFIIIRACLRCCLLIFTSQLPLLFNGQESPAWRLPPGFVCFAVIVVPAPIFVFGFTPQLARIPCSLVPLGASLGSLNLAQTSTYLSFLHFCHILLGPGKLNLLFSFLFHCTSLLSWRFWPVHVLFGSWQRLIVVKFCCEVSALDNVFLLHRRHCQKL